jgi:protein gp37
MGNARYQRDGNPRRSGPGFGLSFHPDKLDEPLRWKRPRRIFVNSMSDLGHHQIPFEFFARIMETIAQSPRHNYQVLTKRPGVLRGRLERWYARESVSQPLENLWIGVSVENQRWADLRIPYLLRTPAAIRFLSCEPLLGPVSLFRWLRQPDSIHWVIVGGESGAHMWQLWPERGLAMPIGHRWLPRPDRVAWVRAILGDCQGANVPFFLKQWGGPHPKAAGDQIDGRDWREFPARITREFGEMLTAG